MPDPIIKFENVSWTYSHEKKQALKNISLEIEEGSFVAVLGENNSGKTTFCRLLNGLIPHSIPGKLAGKVTVDGHLTADTPVVKLAGKVGMVFEDPGTQLFTAKVYDEVAFALENMLFSPKEIMEKIDWALAVTGLTEFADFPPAALSGGQKQRLAIAAALAMAEKILVLDDPVSQLDPMGVREIMSLICELCGRLGLTVVTASCSGENVGEYADKICVLKNGSLAVYDTPENIFSASKPETSCALQSPPVTESKKELSDSTNAITVECLRYRYNGGGLILDNFNLSIADNEFIVIAGQNGCGKTTLLKNISGLLRPLHGNIFIRGKDAGKMSIAGIAGEIGFVMQDPDRQLFTPTVYDEVAFALRHTSMNEKEIQSKTEEALAEVGLSNKRGTFPPSLSRADRVKTVFAAVLATGPGIIMLDEPAAGLDHTGCKLLMDILAGLHQKGFTIIIVTHNMNIAAGYVRRLIVMKAGKVYMDGTPDELFSRPDELAAAGILPPHDNQRLQCGRI